MSDALDRCVGDTGHFFDSVLSREHLYRPGAFDGQTAPVTVEEIDDCVTGRPLSVDCVRIAKDNRLLDAKYYRAEVGENYAGPRDVIDPVKVARLIDAGATLVIRPASLYLPRLRRFCKEIEMRLGHGVDADVFVTPPNSRGFEIHSDAAESLAIQLVGTKDWTLYEPVHPWEQRSFGVTPPDGLTAIAEYTVAPGDFLYVPRGMPHLVRTTDTMSVHVTISVNTARWSDLLTALVKAALSAPAFQGPVPMGESVSSVIRKELAEHVDRLAAAVRRLGSAEDAVEQVLRSGDGMLDAVRTGLITQLVEGANLTALDRIQLRPGTWPVIRSAERGAQITVGRNNFQVAQLAATACALVMAGPAYVKDLAEREEDAIRAAKTLLDHGIAERCTD
ncbi:MAG TPA: cupin domain-containing protein [Pseudonocardiaceae bacterium]|nr:cupin domain-containing protein [Pseudonocardiaceae bacterium]